MKESRLGIRLTAAERRRVEARASETGASLSAAAVEMMMMQDGNGESTRVDSPYREVPIDLLRPSANRAQSSRRERFDEDALASLAASIRSVGVLEPLSVRQADDGGYEVVAGERRWRAARRAGRTTVPVVVREWTDEEAQVAQLVENLQREGLHEIDEAYGYDALREQGWDVARICGEVGRSRSYVFQRLRLLQLSAKVRAALEEGVVTATTARLIATVPTALQPSALAEVRPQWGRELTTRQIEDVIRRRFRRPLDHRAFDPTDPELIAAWGGDSPHTGPLACKKCPWNTSVDPSLGDAPHQCCQPECYDGKRRAAARREVDRAKAKGCEIVHGKAADYYHDTAVTPRPDRYVEAVGDDGQAVRERAADAGCEPPAPVLFVTDDPKRQDRPAEPLAVKVYRITDLRKLGIQPGAVGNDNPEYERRREKEKKKAAKLKRRVAEAALSLDSSLPLGYQSGWSPAQRTLVRLFVDHLRRVAPRRIVARLAKEQWGEELAEARSVDGAWILGIDDGELMRFGVQLCAAIDAEQVVFASNATPEDLLVGAADAAEAEWGAT